VVYFLAITQLPTIRLTRYVYGSFKSVRISADPVHKSKLIQCPTVIIIAMTQGLSLVFSRIRQPRVISEIIGGIILGPTVMGRIPGFRSHIFPEAAMPFLTLTSTIGLVLYLFLVGLEIDLRVIRRNAMASSAVSVAGLVIPLGLGAALGVALYKQFVPPSVNYGYFVLFSAVAIGITAFPVLCRILTELKLLDTTVGVITLSAGVGNDVVGWILLALSVALVNASSGLTALWVLLTSTGYVLFLLYPVRIAYVWLARRTGSLESGQPTAFLMTITILIVFISAFFTDVVGVHAIFGERFCVQFSLSCVHDLTETPQVDFLLALSFLMKVALPFRWWKKSKIL
jgi:Kef-type K+ transport system membrane component KefB